MVIREQFIGHQDASLDRRGRETRRETEVPRARPRMVKKANEYAMDFAGRLPEETKSEIESKLDAIRAEIKRLEGIKMARHGREELPAISIIYAFDPIIGRLNRKLASDFAR